MQKNEKVLAFFAKTCHNKIMDKKEQKRTLEMNKGNWSGEPITVEIDEDGSFEVYGYEFKLLEKTVEGEQVFKVMGTDWDYPLVEGYREGDHCFMYSTGGELSRDAQDPFEAAAQVLFNIP